MDQWKTIYVSMAFPAHLLQKVDKMARQRFMSRSAFIREVLIEELRAGSQKQKRLDQTLEGILENTKDLDDG